jgi:hypothetical protein
MSTAQPPLVLTRLVIRLWISYRYLGIHEALLTFLLIAFLHTILNSPFIARARPRSFELSACRNPESSNMAGRKMLTFRHHSFPNSDLNSLLFESLCHFLR